MTVSEQAEYSALRATIRERGTARVCVFAGGIVSWAASAIATAALAPAPGSTLLPLLVLASVFEAIFALHVGVERIGRYLQVFHEAASDPLASSELSEPPPPREPREPTEPREPREPRAPREPRGWEHAAMAFGRPSGAVAVDALFAVPCLVAALLNLAQAMLLDPTRAELIFVGGAHALFVLRVLGARHAAGRQRAIDLARFQQLRTSGAAAALRRP